MGVGTGFFGAFTTFSSFCLDFMRLMMAGRTTLALLYLLLSMVGGLIAAWLGTIFAQHLSLKGMSY